MTAVVILLLGMFAVGMYFMIINANWKEENDLDA